MKIGAHVFEKTKLLYLCFTKSRRLATFGQFDVTVFLQTKCILRI